MLCSDLNEKSCGPEAVGRLFEGNKEDVDETEYTSRAEGKKDE